VTIIAYVFLSVENWDFKWQKGTNNMFVIIRMALFIKKHVFKFFILSKMSSSGKLFENL